MSVITNTPIKKLGDYTFEQLGSFSVEQLDGIPLDRQFTPVTNTTKVSSYETWDSITTTWDTETRTWDEMGSLMSNSSLKNLGSYSFDEIGSFSVEQLKNVSFNRQFSPITNISKPS